MSGHQVGCATLCFGNINTPCTCGAVCEHSGAKLDAGPIASHLRMADDDQIIAEFYRRGRRSDGAMRPEWLADDEVIAEHKRRFGASVQTIGDARDAAFAARDRMRDERDEWKRRAETAEAQLHMTPEQHRAIVDRASVHVVRKFHLDEDGPGIAATKPDNERWGPSDEDRLCEDA